MRGKVIYMKDDHIKQFVQNYLKTHVQKTDTIIDATVGNGYDTIYIASLAKQVIGFDIQSKALAVTQEKLMDLGIHNVSLIHDSFEKISTLTSYRGVVFNLGYLPNGDKSITTTAIVTLSTVQTILSQMKVDDFILMTVYPGHDEGKQESEVLNAYIKTLNASFITLIYQIQNRQDAPYVILIEKIKLPKSN